MVAIRLGDVVFLCLQISYRPRTDNDPPLADLCRVEVLPPVSKIDSVVPLRYDGSYMRAF